MSILFTFLIALVLTILFTPLIKKFASDKRFFDYPDDRKVHAVPVPLLGGISVYFSVIIACIVAVTFSDFGLDRMIVGMVIGATILVILGTVDDHSGMSPTIKLSGQTLAAGVVVFCNCKVGFIPNDIITVLLSILWIVGITNAMNLLDNMDGMTGGVSFIASSTFAVISLYNGQDVPAVIALALAGASLGYLRYNFPPANIFLGDAGSMVIGFLLATLGLMVANSQPTVIGLTIPLLVLAYPIFDTSLVTITRIADGRRISEGGKDHSTHRIRSLVKSDVATTLLVYVVNIVLSISAFYMIQNLTLDNALALLLIVGVGFGYLGIKLNRVPVDIRRTSFMNSPVVPSISPAPETAEVHETPQGLPSRKIKVVSS